MNKNKGFTKKQKRRFIAQVLLLVIGVTGFFILLNSIGTDTGDFITISTRFTLNVRLCVVGFALITLAVNVYRSLFRD